MERGEVRLRLAAHVHRLSSVGNAFVKHAVKLRQSSSYRHASGSLLIIGDVPLRELCDIAPAKFAKKAFIEYLFVLESTNAGDHLAEFAERIVEVTPGVMHKLSGVHSAHGCTAVGLTSIPVSFCSLESSDDPAAALRWCPNPQRLLALDGIQDPGNLGTLLRTAAAFYWDGVFLLNGCCDPFNEKAMRASRGACFWIPIACGKWNQLEALASVQKMKLYAGEAQHKTTSLLCMQGKAGECRRDMQVCIPLNTPLDIPKDESLCLILGNEGQGLSADARVACSLVSIPMPGEFESLNVAVAGGILLYLLQKQKLKT